MDFIEKLDKYLNEEAGDTFDLMLKELNQVRQFIEMGGAVKTDKFGQIDNKPIIKNLKIALKHLNAAIVYANKVI